MEKRSVEIVVSPREPHFVGDGFRVHNFIPSGYRLDMQRMNPFIMLDYNSKFHFDPSDTPKGVGVHPHRGFETVTIAYKGKVEHHDSSGGGGVIGEGDVQWMTAGKGVQHSEMFPLIHKYKENHMELFQLWLNLPKKNKMVDAHFKMLWSDTIPKYMITDQNGKQIKVEVMAGRLDQYKAPTPPPNSRLSRDPTIGKLNEPMPMRRIP